jgi:hypothetical protein
MSFTVYCHTNQLNGKRYVGWTKYTMEERWRAHIKRAWTGARTHFHTAIRKYPYDFWQHDVICTIESKVEAKLLEVHFIEMLGTWGPDGYNMTPGGEGAPGGHPVDANTRKQISLSQKGRPKSEETKQKMRAGHKRRTVEQNDVWRLKISLARRAGAARKRAAAIK